MKKLTMNRPARFGWLPTAVLMLALAVGQATVGHAESPLQTLTVTAKAEFPVEALTIGESMRAEAVDAAWRTRISVATELSARLNSQHRKLRLASRSQSTRG